MAIVKQRDSRSGITYVYESISWYDKETKNARSKRHLIGRWDEEKGIVIPTDGRCKRNKQIKPKEVLIKEQNAIKNDEYELLYKQAVSKIHALEDEIKILKQKISKLENKDTQ